MPFASGEPVGGFDFDRALAGLSCIDVAGHAAGKSAAAFAAKLSGATVGLNRMNMSDTKRRKVSPWASAKDREAEREEKMEAVLLGAAKAFSENGYHRTSLESIADSLGISKPTLYYYCTSKEDLVLRVSLRGLDRIVDTSALDAHASGLDQLRHTLRIYVEWVTTDFGRCMVLLNEADISETNVETIRDGKRAIDNQLRLLIEKGKADGSITPCDTRFTAFMLAGAINDIVRWYRHDGALSPSALGEIYVNQMTMGLKPRS
jgi:AcrR family transcriptional regulator